jgi:hypothetical protein
MGGGIEFTTSREKVLTNPHPASSFVGGTPPSRAGKKKARLSEAVDR